MKIIEAIKNFFGMGREIPDIPEDWLITGGEGVSVCVVDSGAPAHPALDDCIDFGKSRSAVWGCGDGDMNGHATAVCGIIHAYAPKARLVCIKVAGEDGKGTATDLRLALEGACTLKPDVVCVGICVKAGASKCQHALGVLESLGIPVICAAGNDGDRGVMYPARFPQAIAVGACDRRGRRPSWSAQGPEIDCLYPGVRIPTLWLRGGRAVVSGTSFAAPAAAGVAALWLSWLRRGSSDTATSGAELVAECRRAITEAGAEV